MAEEGREGKANGTGGRDETNKKRGEIEKRCQATTLAQDSDNPQ